MIFASHLVTIPCVVPPDSHPLISRSFPPEVSVGHYAHPTSVIIVWLNRHLLNTYYVPYAVCGAGNVLVSTPIW